MEMRVSTADGGWVAVFAVPAVIGGVYFEEVVPGVLESRVAPGVPEDFPQWGKVNQYEDAVFRDGELPGLADELERYSTMLPTMPQHLTRAMAHACRAAATRPQSTVAFESD